MRNARCLRARLTATVARFGKTVDWDRIEDNWMSIRRLAKREWPSLDDADLDHAGGDRSRLIGFLQERYGWSRARATSEAERWLRELVAEPV